MSAKNEWPETLGMDVADAIKLIKAEFSGDVYEHQSIYPITMDYVRKRVRVWTTSGKVVQVPEVG